MTLPAVWVEVGEGGTGPVEWARVRPSGSALARAGRRS